MGVTERHWLENEEPELTDRQLEDAINIQNMAYSRGYQKGYSDGAKEQEAVEPILIREGRNKNYNDYVCPRCDNEVVYEQNYCSECGVRFLWGGR